MDTTSAAFDLASIEQTESATLELVDPKTDTPLGVVFTLAGPDHPQRRALRLRVQREARKRLARIKGMNIAKAFAEGDPEQEEEDVIAYLVACTLAWRSPEQPDRIVVGGAPLDCTPANVRRVYEDPRLAWIRRQVRDFLEDADNFIESSPTR